MRAENSVKAQHVGCLRYLCVLLSHKLCVGLVITIHIGGMYGIFGREITNYTVIHGVYIQFWPTLIMCAFVT